jgi:signal transduction histidine kinase
MRNGLLLVLLSGTIVLNGAFLDYVPIWRQLLFVVLPVLAYLLGRHLPVRRGWLLITLPGVPAVVAGPWSFPVLTGGVGALGLFMVLPWLAGRFQLQQAGRLAHLEREQEFVRLRERARIAADMHDSLGHDLALIALRAGALEVSPGLSDTDRTAAATLRESAVFATDRLRATVHLLREPGSPLLAPSLTALVTKARDAGLTVDYTGPDSTDPTAHRVAQEALTNASRHAPGTPVTMTVTQHPDALTLKIQNHSAGTPSAATRGTGLSGLHERVTLLGGAFTAGQSDHTFTVTATIPADRASSPAPQVTE